MITLGFFTKLKSHPKVVFKPSLAGIEQTPAGSIVITPFERGDIAAYETYAPVLGLVVYSMTDFIIAAKCGVKYAVASYGLAKSLQQAADHYLYDTRVLALIDEEAEIEQAARDELDGVIAASLLS